MIKKFKDKLINHLKEVISIKTSPASIASGFAIGTFFGIFTTFGLEFLIMFLIVLIFKRVSKVSMIAAYVLFNPLLTFPIHVISYAIGDLILSDSPITFVKFELLGKILTYTRRFIVGAFVMAIFLSVVSYFVTFYASRKYQKKFRE